MSNAVDILLVGGPHDGMVVCQPRPVPAVIDANGTDYVSTVHEDVYRIGRYDPMDDSDVDAAINAKGFLPSWDLQQ